MTKTLKCYGCKQIFLASDLSHYVAEGKKTGHNYCVSCLAERVSRDNFINFFTEYFSAKEPWPTLLARRRQLQDTYGYTDDTIMDTIVYLVEVKKMEKKSSKLMFTIKPPLVDEMCRYKRTLENRRNLFESALKQKIKVEYIQPREATIENDLYDLDDLD